MTTQQINTQIPFSELMKQVDVNQNEISLMGEVLIRSLAKLGIKYTGKTVLTPEEISQYRSLSGEQMAKIHAQKHNLPTINIILSVLQEMKAENEKGNYSMNMHVRITELGLPYGYFGFLFSNWENDLIKKEGIKGYTSYTWMPDRPPLFSDAERIFNVYQTMKHYQLNAKHRSVVDQNRDKTPEQLAVLCRVSEPLDRLCFMYRANLRLRQLTQYDRKRGEKQAHADKNKAPVITQSITRTVPTLTELVARSASSNGNTVVSAPVISRSVDEPTPGKTATPDTEKEKEQPLGDVLTYAAETEQGDKEQGMIYLLNEKNKYLMKIIKTQQKMIEALEKKLLEKINK